MSTYSTDTAAGATVLKGQIVKISSGKWVPATAVDGDNLGVACHGAETNELLRVCIAGECDVLCNGTLTKFGPFSSTTGGKAKDNATDDVTMGIALEVGAADGFAKVALSAVKTVTDATP